MGLPETLEAMLGGPGRLRFIVQPLLAVALGIRDGRLDAAAGRPAYVFAVLFVTERRREALASGLKTLARPLFVAVLIDMVVQFLIFRSVRVWHAVLVGTALIALPYVAARGLANRISQRRQGRRGG
ncbi:MAG TPA: hypothetical protein VF212_02925 [Longimicrobiales bacterium]